jgi:UPF0755 protein
VKNSIRLVVFFIILSLLGAGIYLFQFGSAPGSPTAIEFDLYRGMSPLEISKALEKQQATSSAPVLYWYGKLTGGWNGIKAAEYEIPANASADQIFKIFKSGIGIQKHLLVKEGDNIYQVADAMSAAGIGSKGDILTLMKSKVMIEAVGLGHEGITTLEGYLYPNTYFYDKREKPEFLIRKMVQLFLKNWTSEFEERAKMFGWSRKQVVTLASIIEKETGAAEERPIISSVFHNRLVKKMRIQSDPTTIYGIWEEYSGNLHKSDLLRPTAYNTYTIPALPVGPIANVSQDAIRAVFFPAETKYLYFVSRNDGTHVFSHTYQEHLNWVKQMQLNPVAREGKSWRDLKQNK